MTKSQILFYTLKIKRSVEIVVVSLEVRKTSVDPHAQILEVHTPEVLWVTEKQPAHRSLMWWAPRMKLEISAAASLV